MEATEVLAKKLSRDKSTKCASMILGPDFGVRSMGYNGFPRGVYEGATARHERPEKYFWAEHSERNAIYSAAKVGTALDGCMILVAAPIPPCMDCARAIIQSGINVVVIQQDLNSEHPTWKEHSERVRRIFAEAEVEVVNLNEYRNETEVQF